MLSSWIWRIAADGLDFLKVGGGSFSCSFSDIIGGNDGTLKIGLRLEEDMDDGWEPFDAGVDFDLFPEATDIDL